MYVVDSNELVWEFASLLLAFYCTLLGTSTAGLCPTMARDPMHLSMVFGADRR